MAFRKMDGETVVEFRCGVVVQKSGDRMAYQDGSVGPVYYVYQKTYHYDLKHKGEFVYHWKGSGNCFERDEALADATRRVLSEEEDAERDPHYRVVWAKARPAR